MVKHAKPSKTSRSKQIWSNPHPIQAVIGCAPSIPVAAQLSGECVVATFPSYYYSEPVTWRIPPHLRLANLPTYDHQGSMNLSPSLPSYDEEGNPIFGPEPELRADGKAVESFVRTYGILHRTDLEGYEPGPGELIFREDIAAFTGHQSTLRRAWVGDSISLESIANDGRRVSIDPRGPEGIEIKAHELWTFICFLLLHDQHAGKTAKCANPDCLAPYFIRRRNTQRFCEAGECVKWAQQGYALRWWRENRGNRKERGERKKEK